MKWSGCSLRPAAICLMLMLGAAGLSAQTYQGALRGAVRDAQGVIPGAEVVLINEATNATRSAMTNEVGEYAFTSVLPGTYTIRVSLPGFKTEERAGLRIGTQQSAVLDFTLDVGGSPSRSGLSARRRWSSAPARRRRRRSTRRRCRACRSSVATPSSRRSPRPA